MPPWAQLLAFVLASALLIAVPGPSVLFVVGRSLALGRRGGLLSVLGNTLGLVPHLIAVAAGVGALVAASAELLLVVKVAGALYLIHLGVHAVRHRAAADPEPASSAAGTRHLLGQGFLVGVSNPKTIVFLAAVLPQFVVPDRGPVWSQLLVLGAVFALIALFGDSVWVLAASAMRSWLARSPRRLTRVRGAGGVAMIGLGGGLLISGVPHT